MTLPATGSLSISQINAEFALGNNLGVHRGVTWWTDAGATGTFPWYAISISDFYNKRKDAPVTLSLSQLQSTWTVSSWWSPTSITLLMSSDGTWQIIGSEGILATGNWGTPTTAGIGSSYWIRFTRTSVDIAAGGSSSGTTGWLQLSSAQQVTVYLAANGGTFSAYYSIDISTNSGGTNIVASCTNVKLTAFVEDF